MEVGKLLEKNQKKMFVYLFALALILMAVYSVDVKKKVQLKNPYYYTILVVLILITGLQWRLGGDNLSYEIYYKDIPTIDRLRIDQLGIGVKYQPLWYIFCAILKSITPSFVFFHIVHSIIINTVVLSFFRRYTKYVFTAILLYYLSFNYLMFNIELQRESLAVMCFLLGLKYLQRETIAGYLKYYLFAIVAFFFHTSALITFIIPIVLVLLKRAKNIYTSVIILGALLALFIYLSESVMFSFVGEGISENIFDQAEHYFDHDKNFSNILINGFFNVIAPLIVIYISFASKAKKDVFLYLGMLLVVVYIGNAYFTGFSRMVNYLIFPFYVSLVNVFSGTKKYGLLKIMCITVMIIATAYHMTRPIDFRRHGDLYYNMYIPYQSILD